MRSITGLWRWRGNPLCRPSDRREAWLALCAAVLIVVLAPLAGWLGAGATHDALLHTAHQQRNSRQLAWATAESSTRRAPLESDPESAAQHAEHQRVVAHWKGPDGSTHRGVVGMPHRVRAGHRFQVWTDTRGRLASRPMSPRAAASHSVLAGLAVGALTAAALEGGRRLAVRQVMRRRYARWDAEWQRIGPDWGRTGSNS